MNPEDELGRLLSDAFDAQARAVVGDHSAPPEPRFADPGATVTTPVRRGRTRIWAPVAAAAAVVAVVSGVILAASGNERSTPPVAARPGTTANSAPATSSAPPAATAVRVTTLNADGVTYGVGMPVIAYFSKKITDGRALQAATTATVDGTPLAGAWYFQRSAAGHGPIEGHFRPRDYWPANAAIHISIAARGEAAGNGLAFGNDLTLDFRTGPAQVATVDNTTHQLTLTVDGKKEGSYPVSLGSKSSPTQRGIKVIMEKGRDISMRGPGYYEPTVKDTQRLTYGGEYLHAAPWNVANIDRGVNTSNGCTNLRPADADALYARLRVGDVVTFPNASGPKMQLGQGYGDWNVAWSEWQTGGLVPTR